MPYLYKTNLEKNPNGLQADIDAKNTDKTDFETNGKPTATKIDEIVIAQTTFVTELSYTNFKAKIVASIGWVDVKYTDDRIKYVLNLLTDNPL
ncbi:MAG TPA: hypothetical protein VI727_01225 [Candidatus Brocadiaceae bacterium]|nr:hypothetical protein [Candidatus Brocadiaceae bacterium]